MMNKKAQSAMEYLMTYGWAILVVLIALGALFYLGVFSPKTPSTCSVPAPFSCQDVKFDSSTDTVTLVIGIAGVSDADITAITINNILGAGGTPANWDLITAGALNSPASVTYLDTDWNFAKGTKISGTFTATYTVQSGTSHTLDGQFSGTAEE